MKKMLAEFKKFIKRGNVVDMAIGVAVASAFTAIVNAFTKGIISPLIALLTGASSLAEVKWVLRPEVTQKVGEGETAVTEIITPEVAMFPGLVLQAAIDFLIVATFLFIVMHVAHKLSERAQRIAEEIRLRTDEEYQAKLAKEKEDAEKAALAAKEAADKAAAEAKAKEEENERLRHREIELLETICGLLSEKK
jgi:large conductance mechanosensitive channel